MAEEEKEGKDEEKGGKTFTGDKDEMHVIPAGASGGGGTGGGVETDPKKK